MGMPVTGISRRQPLSHQLDMFSKRDADIEWLCGKFTVTGQFQLDTIPRISSSHSVEQIHHTIVCSGMHCSSRHLDTTIPAIEQII